MTALIIGFFIGATLGFLLACILTVAHRDDEARERDPSDPYGISERMGAVKRTYERQAITPLQGHPRLGLQVDEQRGARVLRHRAP